MRPLRNENHPSLSPGFIGALFPTALFVALASLTWRKWADLQIDFGAELYIPWQLSKGRVLYRDIEFAYGPFVKYWHAILFRIFGVSYSSILRTDLLVASLIVFVCYQIVRRLSD